ncbi:6524_t:CDS:2, partial [Scutellospora calospora]
GSTDTLSMSEIEAKAFVPRKRKQLETEKENPDIKKKKTHDTNLQNRNENELNSIINPKQTTKITKNLQTIFNKISNSCWQKIMKEIYVQGDVLPSKNDIESISKDVNTTIEIARRSNNLESGDGSPHDTQDQQTLMVNINTDNTPTSNHKETSTEGTRSEKRDIHTFNRSEDIPINKIISAMYAKIGDEFVAAKPHFMKGKRTHLKIVFENKSKQRYYVIEGKKDFILERIKEVFEAIVTKQLYKNHKENRQTEEKLLPNHSTFSNNNSYINNIDNRSKTDEMMQEKEINRKEDDVMLVNDEESLEKVNMVDENQASEDSFTIVSYNKHKTRLKDSLQKYYYKSYNKIKHNGGSPINKPNSNQD